MCDACLHARAQTGLNFYCVAKSIENVVRDGSSYKGNATVAQLVEYDLAKVGVAGSSPVSRSLGNPENVEFSGFLLFLEV